VGKGGRGGGGGVVGGEGGGGDRIKSGRNLPFDCGKPSKED